jgi:hypothetical protein
MYDLEQRVWIKSLATTGEIRGRSFHLGTPPRKARYDVLTKAGYAVMADSDNLRAADHQCDGCDRWLPESSFNGGGEAKNPYDGVIEARYCFLCMRKSTRW